MSTQLDQLVLALNDLVEEPAITGLGKFACYEEPGGDWLTNGERADNHEKLNRVLDLCASVLMASPGQVNSDAIARLKAAGYDVVPGEQDSFGWLTGVLRTPKGRLCFG
jgi:hypothetical protein